MHLSDVGEIGLYNWNGALSQALNRGYEFFYGSVYFAARMAAAKGLVEQK